MEKMQMAVSEASSSQGVKPPTGCLVLRVKRKREEDPAEALVVSKHSKLDSGPSVFHFMGTLKEDATDGIILDRLKHYRDRSDSLKTNPLARLSLEDSRSQTRETAKARSSTQRFRVMSQLRCLQETSAVGGSTAAGTDTEGGGREDSASGSNGEVVHICDAVQEELTKAQSERSPATVGAVTCNDTVMIRQTVEHRTDGYVYDLYCMKGTGTLDVESATFDWRSLSAFESELVHDIIDDEEETYEDEDDSNDEDNWRNDYPDEEGSTNSMESELDNCGEYRHRQAHYCGSEEEYGLDDYL